MFTKIRKCAQDIKKGVRSMGKNIKTHNPDIEGTSGGYLQSGFLILCPECLSNVIISFKESRTPLVIVSSHQ